MLPMARENVVVTAAGRVSLSGQEGSTSMQSSSSLDSYPAHRQFDFTAQISYSTQSTEDVLIDFPESRAQTLDVVSSAQTPYKILEDGERRNDYLTLCVPLYQAAIKGDWKVAKEVIGKKPDVVRYGITRKWETALHIAAAAKRTAFVKELVKNMTPDDLALKNQDGNTAICFAAASGIVDIAEVMVEKNENLPMIPGAEGKIPLYLAVLFGHRDMVVYLYDLTNFGNLTREEQIDLFVATVSADLYDVALKILERDPSLAIARDYTEETALHVLAQKPSLIGNRNQLGFWERRINSCFKGVHHKALMRIFAHKLVEKLWEQVIKLQDRQIQDLIREPSRLLFDAAEVGNIEFLIILIRSYPDLIWKVDSNRRSLFHIAVFYRHESIFNLIYEIGAIKDLVAAYKDDQRNNMLHLAGNLAPPRQLHIVSGAALQMQRELLWFKAVEMIVPPSYVEMKNSENQTPRDLFTKNHRELLKDGEKWMKNTATSCMLAATLIATVVFAAAFTVPGGNNDTTGIPIFQRDKWFKVFVLSVAGALFSSSTSIIIFLSILSSRFAEVDFLVSLPSRLMFGLLSLFISVAAMELAFSATIFLVYHHKLSWIPLVILFLACLPVTLFVWLHYRLWADTVRATYWSRFLFQPYRHRLY